MEGELLVILAAGWQGQEETCLQSLERICLPLVCLFSLCLLSVLGALLDGVDDRVTWGLCI